MRFLNALFSCSTCIITEIRFNNVGNDYLLDECNFQNLQISRFVGVPAADLVDKPVEECVQGDSSAKHTLEDRQQLKHLNPVLELQNFILNDFSNV